MHSRIDKLRIIIYLSGLFYLIGCTPIITFQTPELLQPNEVALGIGGWGIIEVIEEGDDIGIPIPSVAWLRVGISDRVNFGMRTGLFDGLSMDLKYSFVQNPFAATGIMGITLVGWEDEMAVILSPTLLAGTNHLYGGWKILFTISEGVWDSLAGPLLGLSVGQRLKLIAEIVSLRDDPFSRYTTWYGIGLQLKSASK